jgi:hypothetical protein
MTCRIKRGYWIVTPSIARRVEPYYQNVQQQQVVLKYRKGKWRIYVCIVSVTQRRKQFPAFPCSRLLPAYIPIIKSFHTSAAAWDLVWASKYCIKYWKGIKNSSWWRNLRLCFKVFIKTSDITFWIGDRSVAKHHNAVKWVSSETGTCDCPTEIGKGRYISPVLEEI